MFEIEFYLAAAAVTAGLCWFFHRNAQGRATLAAISAVAGLLWPILAVGALQLGLFIAVKRLLRAGRPRPQTVAASQPPVRTPPGPRTVERHTEYAAALSSGRVLAAVK